MPPRKKVKCTKPKETMRQRQRRLLREQRAKAASNRVKQKHCLLLVNLVVANLLKVPNNLVLPVVQVQDAVLWLLLNVQEPRWALVVQV